MTRACSIQNGGGGGNRTRSPLIQRYNTTKVFLRQVRFGKRLESVFYLIIFCGVPI
jgi:hypothetical protein